MWQKMTYYMLHDGHAKARPYILLLLNQSVFTGYY